jgi:GT2 family glycosyltransferase
MSTPIVSIITVNYNGWQDTCELIISLRQHETYPYEVIVVDNHSRGDDADIIEQTFSDVIVVRSLKNIGFAGGNNLGYAHAQGKYIFYLNNDMIIKEPILKPLVNRLDEGYGGTSPCILYLYSPQSGILYYGHQEMSPITLRHTSEAYDPNRRTHFLQPHETEVLHGGAMMVRRDVIKQVGQMTEVYFLFYEEFDWSRRIRQAGYKLYYEPSSIVYHKEGMTIPLLTPLREYYLTRSRMIYARRNCIGWRKPVSCLYQLIAASHKSILYLYKGKYALSSAVLRGAFNGLKKDIKYK